jgi:hypothetical protein
VLDWRKRTDEMQRQLLRDLIAEDCPVIRGGRLNPDCIDLDQALFRCLYLSFFEWHN